MRKSWDSGRANKNKTKAGLNGAMTGVAVAYLTPQLGTQHFLLSMLLPLPQPMPVQPLTFPSPVQL